MIEMKIHYLLGIMILRFTAWHVVIHIFSWLLLSFLLSFDVIGIIVIWALLDIVEK